MGYFDCLSGARRKPRGARAGLPVAALLLAGCASSGSGLDGSFGGEKRTVLPPANPLPPGRYEVVEAPASPDDAEAALIIDAETTANEADVLLSQARADLKTSADASIQHDVQQGTPTKPEPEPAASGWLRVYTAPAVDFNARVGGPIAMPSYYESVLEQEVRAAIMQTLQQRAVDIVDDPEATPLRLTYAASVKAPGPVGPRRSRLQIEPDVRQVDRIDQTRIDPISNPGFRPALSFGPRPDRLQPKGPVVAVSMALIDGEERIWSAFAEASLGDKPRSVVARAIVAETLRHWGRSVETDDVSFVLVRPAPATTE
ncbi:MAG: hypothetical protein AAFY22_00090 [Pseudomonadota bacterium]